MKIHITQDEATDPELLKAVGETAKNLGVDLEIDRPAGKGGADEMHISHGDAQDPQKYRRAKAIAAEKHQTLIIDPRVEQSVKIEPGTVMIPRGADVATYRRMRHDAESRGVPFRVAD